MVIKENDGFIEMIEFKLRL